jgi:ABC-type transport system involved in cytochrome bd biosynthesis fused ATPase/permease subunit
MVQLGNLDLNMQVTPTNMRGDDERDGTGTTTTITTTTSTTTAPSSPSSSCAGLSQGQRQLVAVARLVLRRVKPVVVCFDEFTAGMDECTARDIRSVLKKVLSLGGRATTTVIEVAHDIEDGEGEKWWDQEVVLEGGRMKEI